MTSPTDPAANHIPGFSGRPICGTFGGRSSLFSAPTCDLCKARTTFGGMKARDLLNPAHPVGRFVILGSGFGLPGFPHIPGVWKRFGGG